MNAEEFENKQKLEEEIVKMLKTVYDPEIPVSIYDLGLVYRVELNEQCDSIDMDMTMTAPNCPSAEFIMEDARLKLMSINGIQNVNINLVFEPEWNKDMMSEEAKLELGFDI
ncbi:MAG: DUF59 domain-containing protein [Paludibacteraceae bacterium]|nr:DUF59 domain-containing protein [Paludibacteraceae bacterium]